jgi:ElaB/YqjD/DUF883 family membrane-anchored ribosome-binding protein
MDVTSDLSLDNNQNKILSNTLKDRNTNLHDAIDKVAEKAKPAIDSLAQRAHRKVELFAFRAGKLEDSYRHYLEASKNCIQSHPLISVGVALVLSFTVSKLLFSRYK